MMALFRRRSVVSDPPPETPAAETPAAETPPPNTPATDNKPAGKSASAGGLLAKFRLGLRKTAQLLKTDVRDLFRSEGRLIDEEYLHELLGINIKTDMGYEAAAEIVEEVRVAMRGRVVTTDEVVSIWKAKLKELMGISERGLRMAESGPTVILVCGVNGSGKTTSIAKLAHLMRSDGHRVVLGAADTFRAAAVEQLTIWAGRLGVEIVRGESGGSPAAVAYRAVEKAISDGVDVCIIDTAGRLQTQKNLMAELTKIQASISKQIPGAPHEVLLVLDATTGQNGISQATRFTEAVQCTGIVLAKLDGTAKGGVVVAIRKQVGLPVKFVGIGERPEDIAAFEPDQFVEALFDDLVEGAS